MTIKTTSYERSFEPIQVSREIDHQMVHEGKVYFYEVELGEIGNATNNLMLQTGSSVVHLRRIHSFNDAGTHVVKIYENPTIAFTGYAQTTVAANRFISETRTSTVTVYRNTSATNKGLLLKSLYDYAKTGTGSMTNEAVPELILNPGSNYFIQSQHYTPSGNVALSVAWYEFEH